MIQKTSIGSGSYNTVYVNVNCLEAVELFGKILKADSAFKILSNGSGDTQTLSVNICQASVV